MDFVVVTSDEPQEDGEQYRVADEFYVHGNFGLDSEDSGVLYYIDMIQPLSVHLYPAARCLTT